MSYLDDFGPNPPASVVTPPETPEQTRAWQMVGYLNECQQAFFRQKEARRVIPEYPPNCEGFGDDE